MKCISNKKQDWQRSIPMTEFGCLFLVEVEEWFCLNFFNRQGCPLHVNNSPLKSLESHTQWTTGGLSIQTKIAKAAAMAINNPKNRKCGYCKMTTELYYIEVARF